MLLGRIILNSSLRLDHMVGNLRGIAVRMDEAVEITAPSSQSWRLMSLLTFQSLGSPLLLLRNVFKINTDTVVSVWWWWRWRCPIFGTDIFRSSFCIVYPWQMVKQRSPLYPTRTNADNMIHHNVIDEHNIFVRYDNGRIIVDQRRMIICSCSPWLTIETARLFIRWLACTWKFVKMRWRTVRLDYRTVCVCTGICCCWCWWHLIFEIRDTLAFGRWNLESWHKWIMLTSWYRYDFDSPKGKVLAEGQTTVVVLPYY